jgi:hypothetical protein
MPLLCGMCNWMVEPQPEASGVALGQGLHMEDIKAQSCQRFYSVPE